MSEHLCLQCKHLRREGIPHLEDHPAFAGLCGYVVPLPLWASELLRKHGEASVVWQDAPRKTCLTFAARDAARAALEKENADG